MLIVFFLIEISNPKTLFPGFVSTLQFDGLVIPLCGIHFMSRKP